MFSILARHPALSPTEEGVIEDLSQPRYQISRSSGSHTHGGTGTEVRMEQLGYLMNLSKHRSQIGCIFMARKG